MDGKQGKLSRPLNHLFENYDWYRDHHKRLLNALEANGRDDGVDLNEISLAAGMRFPGPIFEG